MATDTGKREKIFTPKFKNPLPTAEGTLQYSRQALPMGQA
jgi:hypothetical protein